MEIRMATEKEARRISYLIYKSIDHISDKSYTEDQIYIWKKINTPSAIRKSLENRVIFCAFEKNKLVGTIGLKGDEVVGLYTCYWKTRKGIGGRLLKHLEEYARENGLPALKITSVPSAENFYLRKGFKFYQAVVTDLEGIKFDEKEMTKML